MANETSQRLSKQASSQEATLKYDVIIIGSGATGLYQLYLLNNLGLSVQVYDDAGGVGGTWYWNRYPGARFDSESYTYGYSFSEELLQEWEWQEHFSPQPETERYFNYVADKFDLRKYIKLNTRITSAVYNEGERTWTVYFESGGSASARFLITAVGVLSARYVPNFKGIDTFDGDWYHTGNWPIDGVDVSGKRVGVIGTGASGIQLISEIGREVDFLTVFQRTAQYTAPLWNAPIDAETQKVIKETYPDIFKQCSETPAAFLHAFDPRSGLDVTHEERLEKFETLWKEPGFKKWLSNFQDVMLPGQVNEEYAEFVKDKIRERVHDPVVAEKLVPKGYTIGSKRIPCETGYYEVFNQDNVLLVDVNEAPIEKITKRGVKTTHAEYELDIIIFATGFDSITGSVDRIDISGESGIKLKDKFSNGPKSFMGMQSVGFPNLFTVNSAGVGNFVRVIESLAEWITDCIAYMTTHDFTRIEPTQDAEDSWVQYVQTEGAKLLQGTAKTSWFDGSNIPGKARALLVSPDSHLVMRARRDEIAANGYKGFTLE